MIKAVFFDWFNTLAKYSPPREELQSKILGEFGIEATSEKILHALLVADKILFDKQAELPLSKRSPAEQAQIYADYQMTIFSRIGVDISNTPDMLPKFMKRLNELYKEMKFILYEDVIPTLEIIKSKNLIVGILTNIVSGMEPICHELGLEPYLDFIVTSGEAGDDKPRPAIFLSALGKAGIEAGNALHVGDQYKIDIIGAMGVGINPLLLDRFNQYPEIKDCPRIRRLPEVIEYL